MKRIAASMAAAWLLAPQLAHADVQARARLAYQVLPGAERCPGEAELRAAVGVRLGYDPFVPEASTEVAVRLEAHGRGIVGALEVRGPRPGQREIASPEGDCREVVDSLATAIAIGLDPASLTRPVSTPPPPPPPADPPAPIPAPVIAPPPPAPVPQPAPAPTKPHERVHPTFGAAGALLLGELPAPAPAIDLSLGLRYRFFGAHLEGSFATVTTEKGVGEVATSLLTVGVVPCAHVSVLFGCVALRLGALRGEGRGVDAPERAAVGYGSAALRVGVHVPLYGPLFVRAYGELDAPLSRVGFELDRTEVWTTPTLAARFAVGAGLQF